MFNLTEFKTQATQLSDLLPWAALVAPGVVLNKEGAFQTSIRFRGPDLASSTDAELLASMARLNNALKRLGSGWAMFIEARRQHVSGYFEAGAFPEPASWMLDLERRELFEQDETHFESVYILTLVYLPPTASVSKLKSIFFKGAGTSEDDYHQSLKAFEASVDRLVDILQDFMFEVRRCDDEETLSYLHQCVSDKAHGVAKPEGTMYLDGVLADTPLVGGVEPTLGRHHIRTISILGFPTQSVPAILDQLNHLPMEYRWMTRFIPLDQSDAESVLKRYKRQWFAKRKGLTALLTETFSKTESALLDTGAVNQARDADAALQTLSDGHVAFGYYTATVTVWDEDPAKVDDKARECERIINGLGFTTILEDINAVEAWLSSIPGQVHANVRMPMLHTMNLAHLIPFSAIWSGQAWNDHLGAPPLSYVHTAGHTPFRLSNHVQDVGHQMIIGPTGAGKSVLMNFMCMQFLRYANAQVFMFDKGYSALASTLGVGGAHYEVGQEGRAGLVFQPLANIDQESERIWAMDWLRGCLVQAGHEISPEDKEQLWSALGQLAHMPKSQRTMTGLCAVLQSVTLRRALDAYTLSGPYGHIFDASDDSMSEHVWQCFEMSHVMNMPEAVAPALGVIFHLLEQRLDGRPSLIVLDEAWLFLDHSLFAQKIKSWLKTLRKQNVSVLFATQSVDDTLQSSVASALLESCPSRIFLPNDRALEPSVKQAYLHLGLNEKQVHMIAHALPKRQYYFQSRAGNALFELALGPIALAFCAQSQPEQIVQLRDLSTKAHDQQDFLAHYFAALEMPWAAEILGHWEGQYG